MTPSFDLQLTHSDKEISQFITDLKSLNVDKSYYLTLLVGPYIKGKQNFMKKAASLVNEEIHSVDLDSVITTNEKETYSNINKLCDHLTSLPGKYVHFSNGDRLSGVYTSYSYSVKRYATPQEKYFLDKIKESEKVILLELKDRHNMNSYIRRNSHAVINFNRPVSMVDKLIWKIKQIRIHGHNFESSRKAAV